MTAGTASTGGESTSSTPFFPICTVTFMPETVIIDTAPCTGNTIIAGVCARSPMTHTIAATAAATARVRAFTPREPRIRALISPRIRPRH
jgi:hypothetical protein